MEKTLEAKMMEYTVKNWKTLFPGYKLLRTNQPIYGAYSYRIIGYADFLFKGYNKYYMVEMKVGEDKSQALWNSLKVIGYAKAYELTDSKKVQPVVCLDKRIVTKDVELLFDKLKLGYITIERNIDGYFFEYCF